MRVAVFGLGYVGSVTAACLAADGHDVLGVEISDHKRALVRSGAPPVAEPGVDRLFRTTMETGRLRVTSDGAEAVGNAELSLICVGTPSRRNGSLDLDYVQRVCLEIGAALRHSADYHVVAVRSTVLPGTIRNRLKPIIEAQSGKQAGGGFGLCSNPEFMREGTAVADFRCPPRTLIGAYDPQSAELVRRLYASVSAPVFITDLETAEIVKYVDNAWHALKIGFCNEVGILAKENNIDSHKVMNIFCQDSKLNISDAYLRPGFAFGGSCLPKDLRAMLFSAREGDLELPILKAVLESNRLHLQRALDLIYSLDRKKVGLLGISFKAGTDDLRESPLVNVAESLIGKGFDLRICDPDVNMAALLGTNREYINRRLPHLASLMVESVDEVLAHADLIIVGQDTQEFRNTLPRLDERHIVIDLVRAADGIASNDRYYGLCW
jgi:GDP-mannose 6-dehydrogenase